MGDELKDDAVRADFLAAFERLKSGVPNHPELERKAKEGVLRVNILSVSMEAGHSRSLIGYEGCAYPDVREEILRALDSEIPRGTLKAEIRRLRNEVSELQDKLDWRDTYHAELMVRLRSYERGLNPDGKRRDAASKSERLAAMSIVGSSGRANYDGKKDPPD